MGKKEKAKKKRLSLKKKVMDSFLFFGLIFLYRTSPKLI